MWSFLRSLLEEPEPPITAQEAMRIAAEECERRGFPTENPEAIREGKTWGVHAWPGWRGSPRIIINNRTGEVIAFSSLPR